MNERKVCGARTDDSGTDPVAAHHPRENPRKFGEGFGSDASVALARLDPRPVLNRSDAIPHSVDRGSRAGS